MVQLRDAKQESGKELLFEPRLEEELTGQVKRKMDELLMDDPSAILLHVPPPLKASRTLKCKSRTKRKQQPRFWKEKEDKILRDSVEKYKGSSWSTIAKMVPGRTTKECVQRWKKVISPTLRKGKWSQDEDDMLVKLITEQLSKSDKLSWSMLSEAMGTRSCKQCRERWTNHLNPKLKKSKWTPSEDEKLRSFGRLYPCQWARIAKEIPGRTENMVKCRWNTLCRREKKRLSKLRNPKATPTKARQVAKPLLSYLDDVLSSNGSESFGDFDFWEERNMYSLNLDDTLAGNLKEARDTFPQEPWLQTLNTVPLNVLDFEA